MNVVHEVNLPKSGCIFYIVKFLFADLLDEGVGGRVLYQRDLNERSLTLMFWASRLMN